MVSHDIDVKNVDRRAKCVIVSPVEFNSSMIERGVDVSFICATCRETFGTPQGPNNTHLTTEDELGVNYFCCEPCITHWEALPG